MSLAPGGENRPVPTTQTERGWMLLEAQGVCHAVSETVIAWLGCQYVESLLGLNWTRFIHPDSGDALHAAIDQIQGSRRGTTARVRLRGVGGRSLQVTMRFVPWWYGTPKGPYPDGIMVNLERVETGVSACQTVPA
jgi:hypothetical protein